MSLGRGRALVEPGHEHLSVARQCALMSIGQPSLYDRPAGGTSEELALMRLIGAQFLEAPWHGSRQMARHLPRDGHEVGRKRVRRLMAAMDGATRRALSWRVSNTMDAAFCTEALKGALLKFGRPEIFNAGQGSQFTSTEFTDALRAADARASMDGRGRWVDDVLIERPWRAWSMDAPTCTRSRPGLSCGPGFRGGSATTMPGVPTPHWAGARLTRRTVRTRRRYWRPDDNQDQA